MKTTRLIIHTALFGLAFLATSCDDILDVTPKDRLVAETYFKTEEQLELFSNRFYEQNFTGTSNMFKENADQFIISPLDAAISGQRYVPETGGGWDWGNLRSINYFLANIHNCDSETARVKYEGIARFFRAYFYFEKVKRFGDVPWYDKVLDSSDPDLYKARDSRELVMDKVMEDVNAAIDILAQYSPSKDVYRITWWTALALKSRMGLFEGTFRKYHGLEGWERYLNDCVEASEELMNARNGYSIYTMGSTPYRNLFIAEDAIDTEIILARDYDSALSMQHNIREYVSSPSTGRPGMSRKMVNYYLKSDGTRFTDNPDYATMEFKDEIKDRDPRLGQTIRTEGISMNGTMTGYQLSKFAQVIADGNVPQGNDLPIFRYAEVLLNCAEAKAELGTLSQDDLEKTINRLRDRVDMPGLNMSDANDNPDPYLCDPKTGYVNVSENNKGVILEIRRERAIELAMEGFRYYDLMRWKEGQCVAQPMLGIYIPAGKLNQAYDIDGDGKDDVCFFNTGSQPSLGDLSYVQLGGVTLLENGDKGCLRLYDNIDRTWNEERDYLYPIPRQEIVLTGGVVKQNPGWED